MSTDNEYKVDGVGCLTLIFLFLILGALWSIESKIVEIQQSTLKEKQ